MIMPPRLRKLMLLTHVATSVGLLGAVAGFLALAIAGLASAEPGVVRAAYPAMDLIAKSVIVPLAFAALLIGLIQSLGTRWGLVRYYWIIAKLVVTLFAIIILLLQMPAIASLAAAAANAPLAGGELFEARASLIAHAAGGLVVLLIPTLLSIYKPRGRTPWRRPVAVPV